ncbi:BRO family protein [Gracilibacillus marinus]|uniref:BRO family protein n=1 Tax=Gracilibacillus marinus TaxID=630535 RepID=A0ABV8VZL4_9BACI
MLIQRKFNDYIVRIEVKRNKLWFLAKDICHILAYEHTPTALKQLETERKDITYLDQRRKKFDAVVDEDGLRQLCKLSASNQSQAFLKWIDSDIIGEKKESQDDDENKKTHFNKTIRRYTVENNLDFRTGYKDFVLLYNMTYQVDLKADMELHKARFNTNKLTIPEFLLQSNQLDKALVIARRLLNGQSRQAT